GCAEQTISLSYPSLLVLRVLKDSRLREEKLEARARRNLESGYRRLLGYRTGEGGFAYWSGKGPDLAVTAYAVEFLEDAKGLVDIDADTLEKARAWIVKQHVSDIGMRGLALRALVGAGRQYEEVVISRLGELARDAAKLDDPYAIATFVLAALDARRPELARTEIGRLGSLARDERGTAYWHLQRNTPYFGWGRAGS